MQPSLSKSVVYFSLLWKIENLTVTQLFIHRQESKEKCLTHEAMQLQCTIVTNGNISHLYISQTSLTTAVAFSLNYLTEPPAAWYPIVERKFKRGHTLNFLWWLYKAICPVSVLLFHSLSEYAQHSVSVLFSGLRADDPLAECNSPV